MKKKNILFSFIFESLAFSLQTFARDDAPHGTWFSMPAGIMYFAVENNNRQKPAYRRYKRQIPSFPLLWLPEMPGFLGPSAEFFGFFAATAVFNQQLFHLNRLKTSLLFKKVGVLK